MANPGGAYPGRQIFLGATVNSRPSFVYFVSGRSQPSQQRYAKLIPEENAVRIKPTDPNEPFDQFRHYQAVRIGKDGLLTVSNNQATQDPVLEAYAFREHRDERPSERLKAIMAAIGPEYDSESKPTPRVMGVVYPQESGWHGRDLGITCARDRADIFRCAASPGSYFFVQTYDGKIDYKSFEPGRLGSHSKLDGETPQELADELYNISDYTDSKYGELRVCTIAGVRNGNGPGGWELAVRNRHHWFELQ